MDITDDTEESSGQDTQPNQPAAMQDAQTTFYDAIRSANVETAEQLLNENLADARKADTKG